MIYQINNYTDDHGRHVETITPTIDNKGNHLIGVEVAGFLGKFIYVNEKTAQSIPADFQIEAIYLFDEFK